MTKEELKQKAEEYVLEKCKECYMCNSEENGERGYCPKLESRKEGYIAGAEPREKRIAELEKRCANYEMTISKMEKGTCDICKEIEKDKKIEELEAKIEKMKADVMANIKWADKNCDNMWQKLVKMWNQWGIKEND